MMIFFLTATGVASGGVAWSGGGGGIGFNPKRRHSACPSFSGKSLKQAYEKWLNARK